MDNHAHHNSKHRIDPQTLEYARALRKPMTPAEAKLWSRLRSNQLLGLKFRRQHPIGMYLADFCCVSCKLVIEVDGDTHYGQEEKDSHRTRFIEQQGYAVIRFCNNDVHTNIDGVLEAIYAVCLQNSPSEQQSF